MRKGIVLVTALVLFSVTGVAQALEDVAVDVDVTWVSKYIFRGFDILDDRAATQPSINFDLGSGLSFNVWSSHAGASRATVDLEEWDYTLTYANSAYDGQAYAMDYSVSWIYYDYPDTASKDSDVQEFNFAVSFPDLCPTTGIVPSYMIAYDWNAKSDGAVARSDNQGFFHFFGLGYDLEVAELPSPVSLGIEAVYNDGAGGGGIDHDWSHIVWSASTSFDCGGGTFTPAIYYQTSMEDTVNTEDELWCGVSYGFSF